MTIDELYRFVKLMANKENRGWIKPTEFNLLATRAQLDLIKDRVGNPSPDGMVNGFRENSQFYDELRSVITYNTLMTPDADGDFAFPANYLYFLGLRFDDSEVDMVGHGDITIRRKSFLNPPSTDSPIGIIISDGVRIFTSSGGNQSTGALRLTYVSEPADPVWAFTTVNNIEIYNVSASTQLVLPSTTHKEIAHRILAYLGVTLREATIVEYGTATVLETQQ
tara:strand:- start:427 stop:1095 length:669 start_codon:yes stop_codon:yes gene_type:complete